MARPGGMPDGPLVGRRRERAALDRLLADAAAGRSRVLVLRGDAGVGKSALLDHVRGRLVGWRVMSAAGVESEMELAYSGLHQLCAPLFDHLDHLPAPQREALATIFGLRPGPAPDRFLVALAVLSLFAACAEDDPVACIVDDGQWLDRTSAQVLTFVARRLLAERVALVLAARDGQEDDALAALPTMPIGGLPEGEARQLLRQQLHGPLDAAVTDRIVAESQGNPLALLELPRTWTPEELAGGFGLPADRPVTGRIERSYVRRLQQLPEDTRVLVLAAAAEPLGDPALLSRAARALGVDIAAAEPALDAGLLRIRGHVEFAHPLVRSATYASAAVADRRRVHRALAEATDPRTDPDRRVWHRAMAAPGADEQVAAELERSAERAQARGGLAAATAFLTRAAELTPDRGPRVPRAVQAAFAAVQAGAFDTARHLLTVAGEGPLDEVQHARTDLVRAQLAFVSRRGNEAAPLLLSAARRLQPVEPDLARETYLDAFSAAQFAARLNDGVDLAELAAAARGALRTRDGEPAAEDLLLAAFADLTDDYPSAVAVGREALTRLRTEPGTAGSRPRRLWQGSVLALELWDDDGAAVLSNRHLRAVREAGALSELPVALSAFVPVRVFCGDLPGAAALVEEARSLQHAAGVRESAYGALTYGAWRGAAAETLDLVEVKLSEAGARGEGIGIAVCAYARAVLFNGLGRFSEALAAAREACAEPRELVVHNWGLPELVESAVRSGRPDLAIGALRQLTVKAQASGTAWALGMAARARALTSDGDAAEGAHREALEHLGRSQVRAELARAHLLYGEWLRAVDRRRDARAELTTAYDMFTGMGLEGFAERARRELAGTGITVSAPGRDARDDLSSQEAQIARLARDGMSNPEIGAQLFISARTVEWHLRKVFTKLGISSRRELRRALPDPDAPGPAG